jgi:hypothetical protein
MLSLLALAVPAACVHMDASTARDPAAVGQPETHDGPTEDWDTTMERARQAAGAHGELVAQQVLTVSGYTGQASQPLDVDAGHCYAASVAWAEPWTAYVSIQFVAEGGAPPVNESLAGRNAKLPAPGGVVEFCADNPGRAQFTISALDAGGTAKSVQARYAIALASQPESAGAAAARRAAEADRAAQTRSQMTANVDAARQKRCDHCWDSYLECRVEHTARAIRNDEPVDPLAACAPAFRECGFSTASEAQSSPDQWPCGELSTVPQSTPTSP